MSRPKKGVGEHRNLKTKIKGPLLLTTALLTFYPVCMAEAATSSFEKSPLALSYATYGHSAPFLTTSTLQNQQRILPKSYRDLLRPASLLPSIEDLNNLKSTLSKYENQLKTLSISKAKDPLNSSALSKAITDVENNISDLKKKITTAENALNSLRNAQFSLQTALNSLQAAQTSLLTAQTSLLTTKDALDQAKADKLAKEQAKASSEASRNQAQTTYNESLTKKELSDASLTHQQEVTTQALLTLNERQAQTSTAAQSLTEAERNLQEAQHNYDTNLIPDPAYVPPTYQKENIRQVPNTRTVEVRTTVPRETITLQEQVIPNLLFNSDFSRGTEGWSGVNAGWQGSSPALIDGEIIFSYQNQTVSQGLYSGPFQNATLTLSADWLNNDLNRGITDTYSMTIEARDINQNPVGTVTYTSTGSHDWERKSITLTATGPVSYITISFSGIDNGFWYGTYGPHFKNPTLQVSHGEYITQTTYEEVITYEEETYYTEEIYYTTEPVLTEGTINVDIGEGGEATFTAPAGAVFISANLRYESYNNPTCGASFNEIAPAGTTSVTIQANNSVFGDPCGGQVKHVVGTITYLGQPTAPLIKDPALLPALNSAQETLNEARENLDAAESQLQTATQDYNNEAAKSQAAQTLNEALSLEVTSNSLILQTQQEEYNKASTDLDIATSNEASSQLTYSSAQQATLKAQALVDTNTQAKTNAEAEAQETITLNEASFEAASGSSSRIQPLIDAANEILNKEPIPEPEPEPEPEQGSAEIPEVIENLMEVNLEQVDPTELTEAQAEQLVEAALVAFETAEEGSPEYEQALEALYLAAEQDDIELPEELAAIPGLAGAVEVLNFLGNAGADMSPKVREESEKVVVATVVAAGAAIQSAAAAAATASAPSGGSRRIGK